MKPRFRICFDEGLIYFEPLNVEAIRVLYDCYVKGKKY